MPYYTILIDGEQPLPLPKGKYARTADGDLVVNGKSKWRTKRSATRQAMIYRDLDGVDSRDAWVEYNQ